MTAVEQWNNVILSVRVEIGWQMSQKHAFVQKIIKNDWIWISQWQSSATAGLSDMLLLNDICVSLLTPYSN